MANQTISQLGSGEFVVGTHAQGGGLTNLGNRYLTPQSSATNPSAANYLGRQENQTPSQQTNNNPAPTNPTKQKISNLDATFVDPSGVTKTYRSGMAEGLIDEYGNIVAQPQGPSEQDINSIFEPSNQYLNQAEGQLRSDLPGVQGEISQQFGLGKNTLDTGRSNTFGQIGEAEIGARGRMTDAQDAQARLYNELNMGGQQRFGGASSAGEAYQAVLGREQQRQTGQISKDFGTTMREIETQKVQVEQQYTQSLKELEFQRDSAINQTNRDFQNKLLEINRMRAANEQAKREARLSALQDLRNQVFQIQLQNAQFQQSLYAQRQQAELELELAKKGVTESVLGTTTALSNFTNSTTTSPKSTFSLGSNTSNLLSQAPIGRVDKEEDIIGQVSGYDKDRQLLFN